MLVGAAKYYFTSRQAPKGAKKYCRRACGFGSLRLYIAGIKKNSIAKTVKLADLRHNNDMTRLDTITAFDEQRAQKYQKAIELLEQ